MHFLRNLINSLTTSQGVIAILGLIIAAITCCFAIPGTLISINQLIGVAPTASFTVTSVTFNVNPSPTTVIAPPNTPRLIQTPSIAATDMPSNTPTNTSQPTFTKTPNPTHTPSKTLTSTSTASRTPTATPDLSTSRTAEAVQRDTQQDALATLSSQLTLTVTYSTTAATVTVNVESANLRSGPSTNYSQVGIAHNGNTF